VKPRNASTISDGALRTLLRGFALLLNVEITETPDKVVVIETHLRRGVIVTLTAQRRGNVWDIEVVVVPLKDI